jgi:adenylate cyclase
MSTYQEIERKFLVRDLPKRILEERRVLIVQGYLAIDPRGVTVRLRQFGAQRFLAVKTYDGEARIEREVALTEEQFAELWPATEGHRLRKVRYHTPYQVYTIEVDIYEGSAAGLIVAEIEFPDERSRQEFVKPDWLGQDISEQKEYSNLTLAID